MNKNYSKNKHCECGKLISDYAERCKSCAMKKWIKENGNPMSGVHRFGKDAPGWKNGEIKRRGYVLIYSSNHPNRNTLNYVKRSRLVMENILNRYLISEEIVHHKNEIRDDDRPENLRLFRNRGEHIRYHNSIRKKGNRFIVGVK